MEAAVIIQIGKYIENNDVVMMSGPMVYQEAKYITNNVDINGETVIQVSKHIKGVGEEFIRSPEALVDSSSMKPTVTLTILMATLVFNRFM